MFFFFVGMADEYRVPRATGKPKTYTLGVMRAGRARPTLPGMRIAQLVGALLVVACQSRSGAADATPFANDSLPVDARERALAICQRLERAGFARNCVQPPEVPTGKLHGPVAHKTTFSPVGGFAKDRCTVYVYLEQKEFAGFKSDFAAAAPPDDYPRTAVASTDGATVWPAIVTCDSTDEHDRWDACRKKSAPAICSKSFTTEYARYKAFTEAAKRIVNGGT